MQDTEQRLARNIVAWQNAEAVASQILTQERFASIRAYMALLFTEHGCSYMRIANLLSTEVPLNSARLKHIRTISSVVALVIHGTVNKKKRNECIQDHRLAHLEEVKEDALAARRESMRKRGNFVFEPEENDFFWNVALRVSGVRQKQGNRLVFDHTKIAEIMDIEFPNRGFTSAICQAKYMTRKGIPKGHECVRPDEVTNGNGFPFEPDENMYFWNDALHVDGAKRPNGRFNHSVIAGAMNHWFRTQKFTRAICQDHFTRRIGVPSGHEFNKSKET